MTVFALHSWKQLIQSDLSSLHRVGSMAPKAFQFFIAVNQSSGSIRDVSRFRAFVAHGRRQPTQFAEPAHAALVQLTVFLQNISLT